MAAMVTVSHAGSRLHATNPRPRKQLISPVYASTKDGKSGIHDPAGPAGSWGTGDGLSQKRFKAEEEAFGLQAAVEAGRALRSEQRQGHHTVGHARGVDQAAVAAEVQEMADERADEEYSHLSRAQKWWMELKGLLYSWLKTGVEPL